jgi:RHS repeat-associated protein
MSVNVFTYTYDADGNQLTAANNAGTDTMTYNSLDQMASVKGPTNLTLSYSYDANGNRTLVQDSLGGVVTSVYNADNLLQTRELGGSGITALRFDVAYDADNRVTTLTRYSDLGGTTKIGDTLSTYDSSSRLTNLDNRNGSGTAISNLTYTFDAGDRVTSQTINGTTTSYGYNAASELTSAGTANFSYDANGNRNMTGYTTGTDNELTNDGTWTYTYDGAGNMTQKSMGASSTTWTYTYDNANHLVGATERSAAGGGGTLLAVATYVYDALGNRLEQDDWTSTGGATVTRFASDGQNVYADMNGSNSLLMRRVFGDGVDQVIARESAGGTVAWYLADRLGSVIGQLDATGSPINTIVYDGSGNQTSQSSPANGDRYGFTGRELDSVTGLQYNRARWYDPQTGRWTSQDPSGLGPDSNLYRYVKNDPTNLTDPSGMDPNDERDRKTLEIFTGVPYKDMPVDEKIYSPKEAPIGLEFADELYWNAIRSQINGNPAVGQSVAGEKRDYSRENAAAQAMLGWRDLKGLDLHIYYIGNSDRAPDRFLREALNNAKEAAKKGYGSINLFFGHGNGNVYFQFSQALKEVTIPDNVAPPLFGMGCCYASLYNDKIPQASQIPNLPTNRGTIGTGLSPAYWTPMIEAVDKLIRERLKKGDKVQVNIYFGEFSMNGFSLDPRTGQFTGWHPHPNRYQEWKFSASPAPTPAPPTPPALEGAPLPPMERVPLPPMKKVPNPD